MIMDDYIAKLYTDYLKDENEFSLSQDTWLNLSRSKTLSIEKTFNLFFTRLAYLYHHGRLNYEFCDILINAAYGEWIDHHDTSKVYFPPIFWQVYEAFDAGEYHRKDDKSDDPIAEHTDPMILTFLNDNNIQK